MREKSQQTINSRLALAGVSKAPSVPIVPPRQGEGRIAKCDPGRGQQPGGDPHRLAEPVIGPATSGNSAYMPVPTSGNSAYTPWTALPSPLARHLPLSGEKIFPRGAPV